jgi:hypothetical protein
MANLTIANAIASAVYTANGNTVAVAVPSQPDLFPWDPTNTLAGISAKGLALILHVTAVSGTTPTLVVAIQIQDPVTGSWLTIHTTITVTITAAGDYLILLYPGMAEVVASYPVKLNSILAGSSWRLAVTVGGTTPSFTFSVDAAYIP